jgi:hypothetical protein
MKSFDRFRFPVRLVFLSPPFAKKPTYLSILSRFQEFEVETPDIARKVVIYVFLSIIMRDEFKGGFGLIKTQLT